MTIKYNLPALNNQHINNEINCVYNAFIHEVGCWKGEFKIKLLIIAEAPLSCNKYFYRPHIGNFLISLRDFFDVDQKDLLKTLRQKGVFVLDLYKYPIRTEYYDNDKNHKLFDPKWFCNNLKLLGNAGLLDGNTKIVFRYKKLISRFEDMKTKIIRIPCINPGCLLRDSEGKMVSLNSQEIPKKILSNEVINYLNQLT